VPRRQGRFRPGGGLAAAVVHPRGGHGRHLTRGAGLPVGESKAARRRPVDRMKANDGRRPDDRETRVHTRLNADRGCGRRREVGPHRKPRGASGGGAARSVSCSPRWWRKAWEGHGGGREEGSAVSSKKRSRGSSEGTRRRRSVRALSAARRAGRCRQRRLREHRDGPRVLRFVLSALPRAVRRADGPLHETAPRCVCGRVLISWHEMASKRIRADFIRGLVRAPSQSPLHERKEEPFRVDGSWRGPWAVDPIQRIGKPRPAASPRRRVTPRCSTQWREALAPPLRLRWVRGLARKQSQARRSISRTVWARPIDERRCRTTAPTTYPRAKLGGPARFGASSGLSPSCSTTQASSR
jgi:hypothetical protein